MHVFVSSTKSSPFDPLTGVKVIVHVSIIVPEPLYYSIMNCNQVSSLEVLTFARY